MTLHVQDELDWTQFAVVLHRSDVSKLSEIDGLDANAMRAKLRKCAVLSSLAHPLLRMICLSLCSVRNLHTITMLVWSNSVAVAGECF